VKQHTNASSHGFLVVLVLLASLVAFSACSPEVPQPVAQPVPAPQPAVIIVKPVAEVVQEPVVHEPVVGSARATTYHRPSCEWAMKISHRNLVTFSDSELARTKGYRPCRSCNPK